MYKLIKYLRPFLPAVFAVIVLIFLQTFSQLFLPRLMARIVDEGIAAGNTPLILQIGGIMLLVALVGGLCAVGANFLSSRVGMGYSKNLRNVVFTHIQGFSLREYDEFGTASLITRTTNDVVQVGMMILMSLRMAVMAPLMMFGGIVMAVAQDSQLARLIWVLMPILTVAVIALAYVAMPLFKALQAKLDKLNLILRENLTGIRVIRAFNRDEHEARRFDAANWDLTRTAVRINRLMAGAMPGAMLLINLSSVAIVWFGGLRIAGGDMEVGSLMAFLQYMMQILFSLMMVSMFFVMLPRALASVSRINAVLNTTADIQDPVAVGEGREVEDRGGRNKIPHALVEFRNVTFSYPGAEVPALEEISFTAAPGEITAIIGGTGSGKSTLVNLIPRFYDVDEGSVLVDGVDVRELTQAELRAKIGYVPQQSLLFSGTVADNICFGKEDASAEEIERAARIAQAVDFVHGLPQGFESNVAQGGTNFSGGQKQRLAIARALVRQADIYIFDDSFSALDFRTDARLRSALNQEISGASILIVAQRVTTVMDAHSIIVLDAGKVAGIGTHKELMETCSVYREIVFSQVSEEEIA